MSSDRDSEGEDEDWLVSSRPRRRNCTPPPSARPVSRSRLFAVLPQRLDRSVRHHHRRHSHRPEWGPPLAERRNCTRGERGHPQADIGSTSVSTSSKEDVIGQQRTSRLVRPPPPP